MIYQWEVPFNLGEQIVHVVLLLLSAPQPWVGPEEFLCTWDWHYCDLCITSSCLSSSFIIKSFPDWREFLLLKLDHLIEYLAVLQLSLKMVQLFFKRFDFSLHPVVVLGRLICLFPLLDAGVELSLQHHGVLQLVVPWEPVGRDLPVLVSDLVLVTQVITALLHRLVFNFLNYFDELYWMNGRKKYTSANFTLNSLYVRMHIRN